MPAATHTRGANNNMDTRCFNIKLSEDGNGFQVRFWEDGGQPLEYSFDAQVFGETRLAGVIRCVESGTCTADDLRDLGTELWVGLLGELPHNPLGPALEQKSCFIQLRLQVPDTLEYIPWEAIYDMGRKRALGAEPRFCLIRDPDIEAGRAQDVAPDDVGLGLMVAIPEGAGLQVDRELEGLKRAVGGVPAVQVRPLRGRVTPHVVSSVLKNLEPEIFHFIGHGELDSLGKFVIRLNNDSDDLQGENWVPAERFAATFADRAVRLAFFNCCYGGRSARASLSGLGPLLLARGIPAIVAMRYPIADDVAMQFAEVFYNALFDARNEGRVDIALQWARHNLYINSKSDDLRGFLTPSLYVARGRERLFGIRPGAKLARVVPPESLKLPEDLVKHFKKGLCVPVLGPGIAPSPAFRKGQSASTLLALIEHLAQRCQQSDTLLLEGLGKYHPAETAFQGVAQIYASEAGVYELTAAVCDWYQAALPDVAHMSVVRWPVPALFSLHFDGLLDSAYRRLAAGVRIVPRIAEIAEIRPEHRVVILVRGSVLTPDSLVLTQTDNENLGAAIDRLPPAIEQVTTITMGRCVLFLGVNPSDPIVRRLARRIVRPRTLQGPAFFVCRSPSAAEKAYWQELNITWIPASPEDVIDQLTALVPESP